MSLAVGPACDSGEDNRVEPSSQGVAEKSGDLGQAREGVSAYRALAQRTTSDQDAVRLQLAKFPAFRGATFPSMVDIKNAATGEAFAQEVKVVRDGDDAGFALVALEDGKLHLHSYATQGPTIVESVLSDLKNPEPQNIEIFQQGVFGMVAVDPRSARVLAASSREVPSDEQWSRYVQSERSVGYSAAQRFEAWDSLRDLDSVGNAESSEGCDTRISKRDEHVVGNRDTPLWSQYRTEYDGVDCAVGCGPIAYAIYLAWAEKQWSEVNVFDGDSYHPAPAEDNDAGDITKAIGDHLNTFCVGDTGAGFTPYYLTADTFRQNMNEMLRDLNRGSGRIKGRFDLKGELDDIRATLTRELSAGDENGKDRPVLIFGWSPFHDDKAGIFETLKRQHIYLVDGIVKEQRASQRCGASQTTALRVNLGWSQKHKTRRGAAVGLVEKYAVGIGTIRRDNE